MLPPIPGNQGKIIQKNQHMDDSHQEEEQSYELAQLQAHRNLY